MEITLDTLLSILGLLLGGGGGAFFTWRYMRRKAKAEAEQAEVDAAKDEQGYYQQIIEDVAKDRDYYKQERDELRSRMDSLARSFMDWRIEADNDRSEMKLKIARLGRKVDAMSPFICARPHCQDRVFAMVSEDGEVRPRDGQTIEPDTEHTAGKEETESNIEPLESEAL